jgi:BirA family biotin operon repressor/biotin-[acetyl-CoA-carboxylase] ligase
MLIHLSETDSTNNYLKSLLSKKKPEEGTIVLADFQTTGKGQVGNYWESERGENLLCSVLFYPQCVEISRQFILSQMVCVAVGETLIAEGIDATVKWPNDIYVGDRKMVGILIENSLGTQGIESCVVGIGINVNQTAFYSDAPNPVSMRQLTGKQYDIKALLSNLKSNLFARYHQLCSDEETLIRRDYNRLLYRKEGFHLYRAGDEVFRAQIQYIYPDGRLELKLENGETCSFLFKEVSFIFDEK